MARGERGGLRRCWVYERTHKACLFMRAMGQEDLTTNKVHPDVGEGRGGGYLGGWSVGASHVSEVRNWARCESTTPELHKQYSST